MAMLAALAVVGYATCMLLQPRSEAEPRPEREGPDPRLQARDEPASRPDPFVRVGQRQPEASERPRRPRALPPAQPRPEPDMDLQEARAAFDELLEELDREIERSAEGARPLSSEAWTEYYRRGSEAIAAIAQARNADASGDELGQAHRELQSRLDALRTE